MRLSNQVCGIGGVSSLAQRESVEGFADGLHDFPHHHPVANPDLFFIARTELGRDNSAPQKPPGTHSPAGCAAASFMNASA
jgi:hypothetical protein